MEEQFSRLENLVGSNALISLKNARVAVFGVGGVGGYVCEALVRCGVGAFDLIDSDTVAESNLNRQIIALHSTVGKNKVDVMKERMLDINPEIKVDVHKCFYLPENADDFDFSKYDYIVDCVDTITAKIEIIKRAKELGIPIISAMGAGNKLDPSRFKVADIYKTSICPLCRVMRRELKKRNIKNLKVVYSDEEPIESKLYDEERHKAIPGSSAFCPSACGLVIASEVFKDLINKE
ncbi:tRNA threonylcarbamoyladenosine dehydratase [Butyrivibrio sp. MB2005]|uniref:tRNA threonylcarbamoyladenosine dehydratase n=1 Tax=Butyrivibrio sp. MB2005 TaxID=1280678 RepID=UPI000405799C|nr:tRNA threonylcarbamoyladenosine dehydratase [Butyrivibrio sp. MB2005]